MQLSLFCSSIRPNLYKSLFDSLKGTTIDVEFVFAGIVTEIPKIELPEHVYFKYIKTADIKPAQVYEVARRACSGELISWTADDAEFPDDVLGKAYRFFQRTCTRKDVISTQTKENYGEWRLCNMHAHRFFGDAPNAPKMAPMGIMNREYFQELEGIDRRFICGQWDNDLLMRVYNNGGKVYHFDEGVILLDHHNKHDPRWRATAERPFGQGYKHDREILEGAWGKKGQMKYDEFPYKRYDLGFEPFEDKDLLTVSQSFTRKDIFHD
jgi:hypothetical protein